MIKYLGIYLDYDGALLISLVNGQVSIKKIASQIDHSSIKGGAVPNNLMAHRTMFLKAKVLIEEKIKHTNISNL